MYSVLLNNGYFSGCYASVGTVEGGVDIETLPPNENSDCYKWDNGWILDIAKLNEKMVVDLENKKNEKITLFSETCKNLIINGFDYNGKHYSLEISDQMELQRCYDYTQKTSESVMYHADGESYTTTSKEMIEVLYNLMLDRITALRLYFNNLQMDVKACTGIEELNLIEWGMN